MATRVNTKFVLILTVAVLGAVGTVGLLAVLKVRGDTTRHIKAGEQLLAIEDYQGALKEFSRAVGKEPSNMDYLRLFEQALLSIRPETQDQARELHIRRIGIFYRKAQYRPQDPEAHMSLLKELHRNARSTNESDHWQRVADAAGDMWQQMAPTDPNRIYAKLYRGLANMRMIRFISEQEVAEAEDDLRAFLEAVPDDDLGWASLAGGLLSRAIQLRGEGNTRRAQAMFEEVDETLKRARVAAPEGPEVAKMFAHHLALKSIDQEQGVSDEELSEAVDRMVELVGPTEDPQLINEAANILSLMWRLQGIPRAVEMLQQYLQEHPEEHFHRRTLANLQYLTGNLDEAYEAARTLVDARPVRVSLLSRAQHQLRTQAASMIVDIEFSRWRVADDADKDAQLKRIETARDQLASLMTDPEREPLLFRAEGKIALAKEDYQVAAANFERHIRLSGREDFEILLYAADTLEQLGQIGLAYERFRAASALRPQDVRVLSERARLLFMMGRYKEAAEIVDKALGINAQDDRVQQLAIVIEAAREASGEIETTDPLAKTLAGAVDAMAEGDLDTARTNLRNALSQAPDNLQLISQLIRVELRAGDTASAREYLDRALVLQPSNLLLRRIEASLDNDDPIEALKQYVATLYEDETDRAIYTVINLDVQARQMDAAAQQYADSGDAQAAAAARSQANRARDEAQRFLDSVQGITEDHPALLEHRFNEALAVEDWDKAGQLVERAQAVDADGAGGLIFKGRYELAQQDVEQAVVTLTDATDRKHYASVPWLLLAMAHEGLGNYVEAQSAYEESYDRNPNDPETVRRYVGLLVQTGDKNRALRILRTARHTIPNDPLLQDYWLRLEVEVGDMMQAIRKRREIYERSPDLQAPARRRNAIQLAALLWQVEPTYEQVVDESGKPKYERDRWNRLSAGEREQLLEEVRTEWVRESEQILDALEAEVEAGVEMVAMRAQFLKIRGEVDAGEQLLRDFIERHSETDRTVEMLVALGQYQAGVNRLQGAIATLKDAGKYQSPDRREADLVLADLYFAHGLWEQAVELYSDLLEVFSSRSDQLIDDVTFDQAIRPIRVRVVEAYAKLQEFDKAQPLLQELIDAGGPDFSTVMLTAAIAQGQGERLYSQGEVEEAERRFAEHHDALAQAAQLLPSSPLPHIQRAIDLLREFRRTEKLTLLDDALSALDRADQVQAGAVETLTVRVEVLRANDDLRGAIGELSRLLNQSPQNLGAWQLLVQLHMETGDTEAALQAAATAIERNPTSPLAYEMKGKVHALRREIRSAAGAFGEAYRLEPSVGRLAKRAELLLLVDRPNHSEVIELLVSSRESLEGEPVLRSVYARALDGNGQRAEALEQMRIVYGEYREQIGQRRPGRADWGTWFRMLQLMFADDEPSVVEQFVTELTDDNPDAYELQWLARSWISTGQGGVSRAVELQRRAVARCSVDDSDFRSLLLLEFGQYLLLAVDYQAAAEAFEQVIAIRSDHVLALNNVAYLNAQYLGDPNKAVAYAKRAAAILPEEPSILDTLGWAFFKAGQYPQAEKHLRRAIEHGPIVESYLHLAHVLARTDRHQEALEYLRKAGELRPNDETQAEIDLLADDISTRMSD
ncbi:MAG: tetratricopeptide repeat protein [Planctomycetes bacterium]|nr:tetratricopeptide repeat protein [Planctomycetota bacterium]